MMTARRALARLTESIFTEISSATLGVLVLARTTCGRCDVYQADIERMMDKGELADIPIGKLVVDEPNAVRYAESVSLEIDPNHCPITVIFRDGIEVDRFATSRASYLLRRIARYREVRPAEPV